MNYEIIYEIPKHPIPQDSIIVGILVIVTVKFMFSIRKSLDCKTISHVVKSAIMLLCILLISAMMILWIYTISYGGSEKAIFSRKYYSGQYEVVEGMPTEYNDYVQGNTTFFIQDKWIYVDYGIGRNPIPNDKKMKVFYLSDDGGGNIAVKVMLLKE